MFHITLRYIALHCVTAHSIALHCMSLHYSSLPHAALHSIPIHCITSNFITYLHIHVLHMCGSTLSEVLQPPVSPKFWHYPAKARAPAHAIGMMSLPQQSSGLVLLIRPPKSSYFALLDESSGEFRHPSMRFFERGQESMQWPGAYDAAPEDTVALGLPSIAVDIDGAAQCLQGCIEG